MTGKDSRRLAASVLAAAMLSSGLPVLAEPTYSTTRISVTAHDIDLSSPAGVQLLRHRVDVAIRTACAPVEFGGPVNYGTRDAAKALDACSADAHTAAEARLRQLVAAGNPRMASN